MVMFDGEFGDAALLIAIFWDLGIPEMVVMVLLNCEMRHSHFR